MTRSDTLDTMNIEALTGFYEKMMRAKEDKREIDGAYWSGYAACYIDQNAMTDYEVATASGQAKTAVYPHPLATDD